MWVELLWGENGDIAATDIQLGPMRLSARQGQGTWAQRGWGPAFWGNAPNQRIRFRHRGLCIAMYLCLSISPTYNCAVAPLDSEPAPGGKTTIENLLGLHFTAAIRAMPLFLLYFPRYDAISRVVSHPVEYTLSQVRGLSPPVHRQPACAACGSSATCCEPSGRELIS
ncbi:hypothetical protein F4775DRAFT_598236 [Biscogniauxia sp. FL1348]|nr:hypothetical protein F4775DRAFT_598236 [Biscogniauxia sp. FL1348]